MQLWHLGLALALTGSATAFDQTTCPCADDGKTISSCTVTATEQVMTISSTGSTVMATTTVTQGIARRRVQRVVEPVFRERYCLAPYKDLGPIAFPDWEGSGICGSRCDPPENDQYVQTVRVVECQQKVRQNEKVCSEHLETWSRTATGIPMQVTLPASTSYACNSAGQYTFQFSDIAPRTYTVIPGTKTVTVGRNGRATTLRSKPTTLWYEPAPYTVQITKYVNQPTIINFTTRITTKISIFLPTSTVTATATITYTKTVTNQATTTRRPTTKSPTVKPTTTASAPTATATPPQFYLRVRISVTEFRYVRFVNGQAKLVTEQDALSGGADRFTVAFGLLRSLPPYGSSGFGFLIGTSVREGTVLIRQFNGFPPVRAQVLFTPTGTEEFGYLIDAISFDDSEGLCVDGDNNLYAVYSAENNMCVQRVVFLAVPRIAGREPSTTIPAASYVTVTTVYRGTGTVSPTPYTTTVAQASGDRPGTVEILYNPSTITVTSTATDSSTNPRTTTIAEQNGSTPGTVAVYVPMMYQTITSIYRGAQTLGPSPSTTTFIGSDGRGTVEVLYNPSTITITTTDSGRGTRTSTLASQTGSNPGTVEVYFPMLPTITAIYSGTGTVGPNPLTTTITGSDGQATVEILYDPQTITRTITDSGAGTRTSTIALQTGPNPGTIQVNVPFAYRTITAIYRGTGTLSPTPYTSTIAPMGTNPGTIEILYNPTTRTRTRTITNSASLSYAGRTSTVRNQYGSVYGLVDVYVALSTPSRSSATTTSTTSASFITITGIYRGTGTLSPTPYTSTIFPAGSAPGTIEILYNPSTITRTFTASDNNARTSTTEQVGSTAGTVDIYVPAATTTSSTTISAYYITITTIYNGTGTLSPAPSTSTIAQPSGTNPGTVEIFYNPNTITSTVLDSGNTTRTSTLASQSGTNPGTVEVLLPQFVYSTITSGSLAYTTTLSPASGTRQGTILIAIPTQSTTAATTTATITAAYVTITTVYRGSGTLSPSPSTTTISQPDGTTPGTVEIFYAPSTITRTTLQGTSNTTSTIAEQTGSDPGLVEVFEPEYLVDAAIYDGPDTLTADSFTSTIATPTGTTQGTIRVFYRPRTVTITTIDNNATTPRTSVISSQVGPTPGTVEVFQPAPSYVTISAVYNGTGTLASPSTTTLAQPTGTSPGTVEVFYNPSTTTITTASGNGTTPTTSTITQQNGTTAGTVEVFIPAYTTITTTSGNISGTSTLNTPTGATQGTVLVVVPTATTTTSADLVTTTTTSSDLVTTNTTTTTIVAQITTTTTVVDPGYVTITTTSGVVSTSSTIQTPSGTVPGTVLVIVPVSTTTSSSTTTTMSADPGYVTITTTSGTVSTVSTIQTPSGTVPGTVLVIIPSATTTSSTTTTTMSADPGYVTITTTSGTVSTVSTIQTPSGTVPGTVLVIVPVATTTSSSATTSSSTTALSSMTTSSTSITTISAVYVTITTVYRGTGTIAQGSSTTIADPTGTAPGTVEVFYNPNTITITSLDNGNTTRTSTLRTQSGTDTGTVEVLLPSYVTITTTSGDTSGTSTLKSATGTIQGTIAVIVPTPYSTVYTTITTVYRGTGTISPDPSTRTVVTANRSTNGTVSVYYNPKTVTITSLDGGNSTRTSTISQQGSTPGTVEILEPSYTTITTTSGYQSTVTTRQTASGTVQGTVVVVRPASTVVYCNLNGASTAPPDPQATGAGSNRGLQYGIWYSPFFDSPPFNPDTGFANYNTTYFDAAGRGANHTGLSPSVTYSASSSDSTKAVYSDTTEKFSANYITLIHRGFLYSRVSGTYTFTMYEPDDIVEVWVGQYALSGFTRQNANFAKAYNAGTQSFTVTLPAGQYTPFRIQWANGGVPATLRVGITNPAGATLLDGTGSTDIVSQACDGSTPKLPQWYPANYVTTTITSGYATTTATSTINEPISGTPGTVEVIVPTPVYCTSTTSVSSNAPGASATSNVGLQYGVWNNTAENPPPFPSDQRNGYPNYNVAAFDGTTAIHVGTTNEVGFPLTGSDSQPNLVFPIYNDAPQLRYNIGKLTIIHRGFLFARLSGTYTFTSASADDITFLWTGNKAISGFTRQNADLIQSYYATTDSFGRTVQRNTPVTFTLNLVQGQYLPIRIQWADAGPPGELNMNVTGPDGGFRIRRGQAMADIITNGCGGNANNTTPAFSQWNGAK